MFDYINAFITTHYWTVSYALSYTLGTIASLALISRFVRMFPIYIKTGSLGNEHLGMFFSYNQYHGIHGLKYFKVKVRDFFTATHLETIIFDMVVCFVIIAFLHLAWIVFAIAGLAIGFIYGVVKFVKYLRKQHVKKEEFYAALRGD